ncbi:MAG: hypothetical protein PHV93_02295 [Candidatus Pacebacteria bacterium]|nr:hypothetical protein [Candidatus Paceibacterota bacterium]
MNTEKFKKFQKIFFGINIVYIVLLFVSHFTPIILALILNRLESLLFISWVVYFFLRYKQKKNGLVESNVSNIVHVLILVGIVVSFLFMALLGLGGGL